MGGSAQNGTISLPSERKAKIIRAEDCPGCPFVVICSGPDDKTSTAEIHDTISENPTDAEIIEKAACLKER